MQGDVLLIEDEPSIAEAIGFLLSRDGCRIRHLTDGSGLAAALRDRMPDLVILDLMLPGASGLDVLQDLRAGAATAALPVLMLTAKGHPEDRDAATRAGVTRFMTKPFANADLVAAVRDLLGRTAA